jgi:hypothetical protein
MRVAGDDEQNALPTFSTRLAVNRRAEAGGATSKNSE